MTGLLLYLLALGALLVLVNVLLMRQVSRQKRHDRARRARRDASSHDGDPI